ncbi:uncharacterized protein LOC119075855 isoform X2 [Bradysia coprophila]|uniref:uncharacterized protein LOC119075855 isoform X2 n=1 Tax=Bradysia coprophila TaxID=38358 RepID=UPI00187DBFDB|nr:uncharacterized protein LOC119075855 isoform X2 [Bradysia coprophila]
MKMKYLCAMCDQSGVYTALCFLLLINVAHEAHAITKYLRSNEICSANNGKRIYLELGDKGVLKATNITTPIFTNNKTSKNDTNQALIQFQCTLDVVTCPSCIIKVEIRSMNFSRSCNAMDPNFACKCDYLHLSEPPYEASGKVICGQPNHYATRTRTLSIKYFYRTNNNNVFELTYTSERNQEEIAGTLNQSNFNPFEQPTNSIHTLSSPFFPALYPRDYATEHSIHCNVGNNGTDEKCRIRVIFTDFQIALDSTLEIQDYNGEQLDVFTGTLFRPPILISHGPTLLLRFNANGASGMGYRALVHFLTESQANNAQIQPDTDCGGHVEMMGGAITMMKMVSNDSLPRLYDCIWLIRPPIIYSHLKTHISLRVESFDKMGSKSILTIKQGMTSDRPDMETVISSHQSTSLPAKTFLVPITSGFYVSLRGAFSHESVLALVYTTFSYMNCYVGSEFLCQNHRCIPVQLQCDGFDHCGDKSDEPDSCIMELSNEDYDRKWYSHTPNYYFPKIERYPDLKTATIVFFASSLGLIGLISALVVLLYRTSTRVRHQRELQNHLQTISELLDNTSRQEEIAPETPPPYEPYGPPSYDEIIKGVMDDQMNKKEARRKSCRRKSKGRSTNPNTSNPNYELNTHSEVILPPETPTSSTGLLPSASASPNPEHYPHPMNSDTYLSRLEGELIAACILDVCLQRMQRKIRIQTRTNIRHGVSPRIRQINRVRTSRPGNQKHRQLLEWNVPRHSYRLGGKTLVQFGNVYK